MNEKKRVAAGNINQSKVDDRFRSEICEMLRYHEGLWNGKLGNPNADHAIDLKESAHHINPSQPLIKFKRLNSKFGSTPE